MSRETLVATDGIIRMWAQNGQICIEDSRDNSFCVITVEQAERRLAALATMLGTRANPGCENILRNTNKERVQRFITTGAAVVQRAKTQGMPGLACTKRDVKILKPRNFVLSELSADKTTGGVPYVVPSQYSMPEL